VSDEWGCVSSTDKTVSSVEVSVRYGGVAFVLMGHFLETVGTRCLVVVMVVTVLEVKSGRERRFGCLFYVYVHLSEKCLYGYSASSFCSQH
jgi:hypothetical protein